VKEIKEVKEKPVVENYVVERPKSKSQSDNRSEKIDEEELVCGIDENVVNQGDYQEMNQEMMNL